MPDRSRVTATAVAGRVLIDVDPQTARDLAEAFRAALEGCDELQADRPGWFGDVVELFRAAGEADAQTPVAPAPALVPLVRYDDRPRLRVLAGGTTDETPGAGAWGSASSPGQAPAPAEPTPAGAGQATVAPASLGDGGEGSGADTLRPGPDQTPEGGRSSAAHSRDATRRIEPTMRPPSGRSSLPCRSSDQYATDLITWRTPS